MDPSTSKVRGYDLTYTGVQSIWTGLGASIDASSPSTSSRSGSTFESELPSVQQATRETIKQSPAAWKSLQKLQVLPAAPSSVNKDKPAEPIDPAFLGALQAINTRRATSSHPGQTAQHRLPKTEREAARRMILAICGERNELGGNGEVNRFICRLR